MMPDLARETYESLRAYRMGWCDGVQETLLQLRNSSTVSAGGGYTGPMPDELVTWLAGVEMRLNEVIEENHV